MAVPLFAGTQPAAKIPRIALVYPEFPAVYTSELSQKFERRLRQLGYVEGRNIYIERRSAQGRPQHLPHLIKEVVDLHVEVIVTIANGALEARRVTGTIPIVAIADDPIEAGLTVSISRPTENVTGATASSDSR